MAVSKLGLSDLNFVRQELHNVKEKWLDIGMELRASPTELRKIAETHKQDYRTCLNLMLMQWLESGDASWKILCEALKSSTVEESGLGTELQEKHCSEKLSEPTSKAVKRANTDDTTAPKAKRAKPTPLPTSFAPEDFLRTQPPNRICYKCNKIPRTPLRPECCSEKLYCEPCSLKVKICSAHQIENKFKRDDELFRQLPYLKVKCPNWKEGCEFKDTASKVHREHLPHCTKSKKGVQNTNNIIQNVGNEGGIGTQKTGEPGSRAADSCKPSSEHNEEDVWYDTNEEVQPHKTTTASTTAPATLQTLLSPKDTASPSLPTKKPKSDVQGPTLQSTTSQQQRFKSSADMKGPILPQKPGDSASVTGQQAKSQINRLSTQKLYDAKQLGPVSTQLQADQMVWCSFKQNGCTWKGTIINLIQHLSVCQYRQKNVQAKVKTEIKQEQQVPPATLPVHQAIKTQQQAQYIKKEPSSSHIFSGSVHQDVHVKQEPSVVPRSDTQPCEYKAIGCKEMVPKGKMKQHLQEGVQHHLDLAIKRILHNEAKK